MSVTPYKRGVGLLLDQDMPHLIPQPKPHHTNEDISLLSSPPQEVEDPNITYMEEGCSMVQMRCFAFLLQRLEKGGEDY